MVIIMNRDRIRKYDGLDDEEKHKYQIEDLINDYGQLKKLREAIQVKYFSIYEELLAEDLIGGELDVSILGITREHENEVWCSELRLMSVIKINFDIAINMIESGEVEKEKWSDMVIKFDIWILHNFSQ